jgi:hypothetical protein
LELIRSKRTEPRTASICCISEIAFHDVQKTGKEAQVTNHQGKEWEAKQKKKPENASPSKKGNCDQAERRLTSGKGKL